MGEEEMQNPREENGFKKAETAVINSNDLFHEQGSDSDTTTISSSDSMKECLTSSPSTSDFMEDASSPTASYSSSSSSSSAASSSCSLLINDINGPLDDLSELMAKLPLKRGLSEYYQGKSQSFTCLASANSLEDLAKKENPYNKRIKMCGKGYGGGLDLDEHFISERFCSDPMAATTSFAMKSTDNSSRSGSTVSAAMGRRRRRRRRRRIKN